MANTSSAFDVTATPIVMAVAHAPDIIYAIGARPGPGGVPLQQVAADNPRLLQTWATARGQGPEVGDRRTYARLLLALIDAQQKVGFHAVPPPPRPTAPPDVIVPAAVPVRAAAPPVVA